MKTMSRIFTAGSFYAHEILRSLDGVVAATKTSTDVSDSVRERFQRLDYIQQKEHVQSDNLASISVDSWFSALSRWDLGRDSQAVAIARLTIAITALKRLAHTSNDDEAAAKSIFSLWPHICKTMKHPSLQERWLASRSAYGFLTLPLYRPPIDSAQNEVIRLDVWLPDGNRGNPDFTIRSNQTYTQSWVLAGKGAESQYDVHSVTDESDATHAEYRIDRDAATLAKSEAIVNCTQSSSQFLGTDTTYSIPAGKFHKTQVQSESLYARLSYFDASHGFTADLPVLGPIHGDSFTQAQESSTETISPQALADQILQIQSWKSFVADGEHNAKIANWEHAKQSFDRALATLDAEHGVTNAKRYRAITLGKLGRTNRQFGRNAIAAEQLQSACADLEDSVDKVKLSGELGTAYRQLGRLVEARASFEMQYDAAKALAILPRMCQAIGNIGMVNYQLWEERQAKRQVELDAASKTPKQSTAVPIQMLLTPTTTLDEQAETSEGEEDLLALAVSQLRERLRLCREIQRQHASRTGGGGGLPRQIAVWAAVGFSRLALCLIAQGDVPEAVHVTRTSIEHARATGDPTVVAISHFFHGLALAADSQPQEAFAHFNAHEDGCTPAIAFSKEPSDEHRGYLETIIAAGADLTLVDGQGYTALDYAVFSSDEESVALLVRGLRRQLLSGRRDEEEDDVDAHLRGKLVEARRRKGYREVFQDIFRPILRGAGGAGDAGCIGRLRAALAHEFNVSGENATLFDSLRAVPYSVFAELGRLPRFTDGLTQELSSLEGAPRDDPLWQQQTVLFISYRWLNSQNAQADDAEHTQYHRIRNACERFMRLHTHVTPGNLYLWIVSHSEPWPLFPSLRYCHSGRIEK